MSNTTVPDIDALYEVNPEYHPFNLDNCLKPGDWPTVRILDVKQDNVLIRWESGDRVGSKPDWIALVYFQADVPMFIPALGMDSD